MATIQEFCEKIERERHDYYIKRHQILVDNAQKAGRRTYFEIGFDDNKKYVRVWQDNGVQTSVVCFVEKETGTIYGADGWKRPNMKRCYGNLDTINDWDWSEYYAVSKTGQDTLVPKAQRKR